MSRPSFKSIKNIVLCEFYDHAMTASEGDVIQDSTIGNLRPYVVGYPVFQKAVLSLVNEELIDKVFHPEQNEFVYEISVNGLNYIDLMSDEGDESGDEISLYLESPSTWAEGYEALYEIDTPTVKPPPIVQHVPASNRTVTLNHNGEPYKEAVRALEILIQEFRKDHKGFINHFEIEDSVLFKVLEAGRDLLDETEVYLETAENVLVRPIKRIIERYDQAVVGGMIGAHGTEILGAAKTALDAVLKLLGLA